MDSSTMPFLKTENYKITLPSTRDASVAFVICIVVQRHSDYDYDYKYAPWQLPAMKLAIKQSIVSKEVSSAILVI